MGFPILSIRAARGTISQGTPPAELKRIQVGRIDRDGASTST
jgi:hypothetical protein